MFRFGTTNAAGMEKLIGGRLVDGGRRYMDMSLFQIKTFFNNFLLLYGILNLKHIMMYEYNLVDKV